MPLGAPADLEFLLIAVGGHDPRLLFSLRCGHDEPHVLLQVLKVALLVEHGGLERAVNA